MIIKYHNVVSYLIKICLFLLSFLSKSNSSIYHALPLSALSSVLILSLQNNEQDLWVWRHCSLISLINKIKTSWLIKEEYQISLYACSHEKQESRLDLLWIWPFSHVIVMVSAKLIWFCLISVPCLLLSCLLYFSLYPWSLKMCSPIKHYHGYRIRCKVWGRWCFKRRGGIGATGDRSRELRRWWILMKFWRLGSHWGQQTKERW